MIRSILECLKNYKSSSLTEMKKYKISTPTETKTKDSNCFKSKISKSETKKSKISALTETNSFNPTMVKSFDPTETKKSKISAPIGAKSFNPTETKESKSSTPLIASSLSFSKTSRSQIEEFERVFTKFDINRDGLISWDELGSLMESLGQSATEDALKKMVGAVDENGDGFIDIKEFMELNFKGVDAATVTEDLRNAFLVYDLDNNGLISVEELQEIQKRLGEYCSLEECHNMIYGVDIDGDGAISFTEFQAMMSQRG
ncbi:hypothetical protein GIB67_011210 [Kingdonia uniflora]|uniref:EF-hand domain-containing protein n=1 Tax=Kingdonia uniflora TaxID=39325 RepID=A0A7J7M3Y5_9MAGN|nr:hypothetical protein GIB67_011210 [Kingdonia uniflora]